MRPGHSRSPAPFRSRAIGGEFDGFALCTVYHFGAILDLLAFSAVLAPLDVVASLEMNFDLAANQNLVTESTVRLYDGR